MNELVDAVAGPWLLDRVGVPGERASPLWTALRLGVPAVLAGVLVHWGARRLVTGRKRPG